MMDYSSQILITSDFSSQIFEKFSNVKIHENPSSRIGDVPCEPRKRQKSEA